MNKTLHINCHFTNFRLMLVVFAMSFFSLLVTWWVEQFAKEVFRVW